MSLLLNALKKAEEGEKKDGQTPAPESGAQASPAAPAPAAPAPAASAPATPTPAAPAATPTPAAPAAATPAAAPAPSTPAAPAARPGGLAGGGLSLKDAPTSTPAPSLEGAESPAPAAPAAAAPAAPATGRVGGIAGMGLKKTAAPEPKSEPTVGDDDAARVAAGRVFRGGESGEEDEGSGRGFRALRNFLLAAAFLAAVGGGGYFTLEGGYIPGVSTQSLLQLVGVQPPPPPPVAAQSNLPSFNVEQGEILRLPRPAIDVQSEIDFTSDLPEASAGAAASAEEEGRKSIASLITDYEEQRREEFERERAAALQQLIAEGEASGDFAGVVDVEGGGGVPGQQAEPEPLSDEVFTAAESRAEKARIEALTPSEDDIFIISASEKVAMMAAEAQKAEEEAAAVEMADGEGEVAQAEGEAAADESGTEGVESEAEGEEGAEGMTAPEGEAAKEEKMAAEETIVAPSLRGEERRLALDRAKRFYLSGNLEAAEAAYRALWRRDPNNLDAMRGMAQVALSSGRRQLARTMYSKILELYPNDPVSIAELANMLDGGDPLAMERRIYSALGKHPEADARLYFALGNLYAGRELWFKAQEAYFEAVTLEANNPDYTYNLAVVLDYLNKPLLAARYYRQALDLAKASPSGFNLAQTEARIRDLEQ